MDAVETMFSVREKPWHYDMTKDRTKIIQECPTSEEALNAAGLNWEVRAEPVFLDNGILIPNTIANVRSSDNSVLGVVSDRYKIVQNRDAFAFTDNLIGGDVRYETAGSLFGGQKVWLLAKTENINILGDEVEPYICFANSHDGSGAVTVCMTPVRVVCNNTLNFALKQATRKWSTRHMGDINSKMSEAQRALELSHEYMHALAKEAEDLAKIHVDTTMLEKLLNKLFEVKEDATKRQLEVKDKQREAFMYCYYQPDIANFFGTAWGVVNAAADMADHAEPNRKSDTYEENNWGRIMTGHPLVDKAYSLITC